MTTEKDFPGAGLHFDVFVIERTKAVGLPQCIIHARQDISIGAVNLFMDQYAIG
jgi:hypothetical protein